MSIKAPGGEPYRYKLTLEVTEEGDARAFSASGSCVLAINWRIVEVLPIVVNASATRVQN